MKTVFILVCLVKTGNYIYRCAKRHSQVSLEPIGLPAKALLFLLCSLLRSWFTGIAALSVVEDMSGYHCQAAGY